MAWLLVQSMVSGEEKLDSHSTLFPLLWVFLPATTKHSTCTGFGGCRCPTSACLISFASPFYTQPQHRPAAACMLPTASFSRPAESPLDGTMGQHCLHLPASLPPFLLLTQTCLDTAPALNWPFMQGSKPWALPQSLGWAHGTRSKDKAHYATFALFPAITVLSEAGCLHDQPFLYLRILYRQMLHFLDTQMSKWLILCVLTCSHPQPVLAVLGNSFIHIYTLASWKVCSEVWKTLKRL